MTAGKPRWGKAGVRLTEEQVRQKRAREFASKQRADEFHKLDTARAREKWAMGLVVPAHITIALDAADLYGPEVDRACGVVEPAVDMWEAGRLYPTWEQIVAVAELTRKTPAYFMAPVHHITSALETSMRFHVKRDEQIPLPVHKFTYEAMRKAWLMGVRP